MNNARTRVSVRFFDSLVQIRGHAAELARKLGSRVFLVELNLPG
jgi:hypothetical protein